MPQINTQFPNVPIQPGGASQIQGSTLAQAFGLTGEALGQVGRVLQAQEDASHVAEAFRASEDYQQALTNSLFELSQQPLSAREKASLIEERIAAVQEEFQGRADKLNRQGQTVFLRQSTTTTNRARLTQFTAYQQLIQQETLADIGFAKDEIISRAATRGVGAEQSKFNDDEGQPSFGDELPQLDAKVAMDQVEVAEPDILDQEVVQREEQERLRQQLEKTAAESALREDVSNLVLLYSDPNVVASLGGPAGARGALRAALEELAQTQILLAISKDPLGAIERIDQGNFLVPKLRVGMDGSADVVFGQPSNPVEFERMLRAKAQEVLAAQSAAQSFRAAENARIRTETKLAMDNELVGMLLRGENIEDPLGQQEVIDALGGERALTLSNANNERIRQSLSGELNPVLQNSKIDIGLELSDRSKTDAAFEDQVLEVLTMNLPAGVRSELGNIIKVERQFRAGKADDQFEKLVSDGKDFIRKVFPDPVFDFGEGSAVKALSSAARYEYQLLVRQNPPQGMSREEWATQALRRVIEPKLEAAGEELLEQQRTFGRILQRYTGTGIDPWYAIENDVSLNAETKQLYHLLWEATLTQIKGGLSDEELKAAIASGSHQITEEEAAVVYPKVEKRGITLSERLKNAIPDLLDFSSKFLGLQNDGGKSDSSTTK